ncbi:hypothetical protein EDB19DRAFT_1829012 [Suillus lakei]|nr:hypothetical protein EDB19DRAFT_1829012 [Suillus lakei]
MLRANYAALSTAKRTHSAGLKITTGAPHYPLCTRDLQEWAKYLLEIGDPDNACAIMPNKPHFDELRKTRKDRTASLQRVPTVPIIHDYKHHSPQATASLKSRDSWSTKSLPPCEELGFAHGSGAILVATAAITEAVPSAAIYFHSEIPDSLSFVESLGGALGAMTILSILTMHRK